MDDSRLKIAKECLFAALVELGSDRPKVNRINALLDDARCEIVEVVDSGLNVEPKADLAQLDSARVYINRCLQMLSERGPWLHSSVEQFIGHSIDHLTVVLSGNVVALSSRRNQPTTPGDVA